MNNPAVLGFRGDRADQLREQPRLGLPAVGVNIVVLQDSENDGKPATAFNALAAANLIAGP